MSDGMAYLVEIDHGRRVWGQYREGFGCSFYIVCGEMVTELHLTLEATEAMRLVIERLQNEVTTLCYTKISTQAHSPNQKTPIETKKAGSKRKTKKRPSKVKGKK